jgi:Ca2+-transporting ATPase
VEEASLTGESLPVAKTIEALPESELPLAERRNMVFMGTSVVSGKARALMVNTGMQTELGKIAGLLQEQEIEPTPLQKKLAGFGKFIVKVCLVLVALVFLMQWLRDGNLFDSFLTAVSLAVAAIPEGLPAVVTVALALGVQRMVKRHVLIRKLPAVETLGCATVICSDKTGTLTKNEMTVRRIYAGGKLFLVSGTGYEPEGFFKLADGGFGKVGQEPPALPDKQRLGKDPAFAARRFATAEQAAHALPADKPINPSAFPDLIKTLECGVLCNAATLRKGENGWKITGDPTEAALLTCAAKAGVTKETLEKSFPLVEELPFDSQRKMMTMLRRTPEGRVLAFVKGAPDILLQHCSRLLTPEGERAILDEDRSKALKINAEMAGQAMRVLAVAFREMPDYLLDMSSNSFGRAAAGRRAFVSEIERPLTSRGPTLLETVENDLTFAGLVAMIDPPREEARTALLKCETAGIRTIMITGDHKNTAMAIARELGMAKENSLALSGDEFSKMDDKTFENKVESIAVYARVAPEHKLRIVKAWRKRGEVVAMTGDGVNDAPAIKEADIGVAMGITGTDVTKEVADMVVTDDNFASIVSAVEEGRGIYDNILKFVHYLLSCNAGEILVMFLSSLFGLVPLLPIHILWVNLVTDGLPALALGMDPVDPGIMNKKPRLSSAAVVGRKNGLLMLWQGLFIALCTLFAFGVVLFYRKESIEAARTAAFMVLACSQLFHAFNCRSNTESIFKLGFLTNPKLLLAVGISFILQVVITELPFSHAVFKTVDLVWQDWVLILVVSSFPLWAMEIVKWLCRIFAERK